MSKNINQPRNDKYEAVILPVDYNKSFLDFTKDDIQKYYEWFLKNKNQRLVHLCSFLFVSYENCLREENLNVVETFLLHSVSTVPKPNAQIKAESKAIPLRLKRYARPDNYLLDYRTISICYDIGIFLGDLIISLDSKIRWELEADDDFADYGQPVLIKKNCKLKLNPFRVVKNAAAKIHEGDFIDGQLTGFFNAWKRGFKID